MYMGDIFRVSQVQKLFLY